MINAKTELIEHLEHIGHHDVKYIHITVGSECNIMVGNECRPNDQLTIAGTSPDEVLPLLDFEYDNGFGGQYLFGNVWYEDGTWSERGEYDGSEWWRHQVCPDIPNKQ